MIFMIMHRFCFACGLWLNLIFIGHIIYIYIRVNQVLFFSGKSKMIELNLRSNAYNDPLPLC